MAHVQVRWYGGGGGTPGGRGGRKPTATIYTWKRRERLRPASDGDDPWAGEIEIPYLPTEFGWEAGEEVLGVAWLVTLFGQEWNQTRVRYKFFPLLGRSSCCRHFRSMLVEQASTDTIEPRLVTEKEMEMENTLESRIFQRYRRGASRESR